MVFSAVHIGALALESPVILAPLAGVTNRPFRRLAREAGCAMVCTEMVSADGLILGPGHTSEFCRPAPDERPLSVQLFGSDPQRMAQAAAIVEAQGADVLDLNFGCAVRKVVKTGAGAALMGTPRRAQALIAAVRSAVRIPLTIKIRSGWDASGRQALALGAIAQDCGVDAVTLHPRTAAQKFSGRADWGLISLLKQHLRIPVIGNGDVFSAEDALRMRTETGCDAVMVGRGAIGFPGIFTRIAAALRAQPIPAEDLAQRLETMRRYVELSVACYGEETACRLMRSRLGWFTKGLRHGSRLRQQLVRIPDIEAAYAEIEAFGNSSRRGAGQERQETQAAVGADAGGHPSR
jgi:nifR3 family TIM-barrel protein